MNNYLAQKWINMAIDDLQSAEIMFDSGRYNWTVVMVEQAVEKAVKALYISRIGKLPPKTHNIEYLIKQIYNYDNNIGKLLENVDFYSLLTSYYIKIRYPDVYDIVIQKETCQGLYNKAEEVLKCVKSLIEK